MTDREKQILKFTQEIVSQATLLKGMMPKALNDKVLSAEEVDVVGTPTLRYELICIRDWITSITEKADGKPGTAIEDLDQNVPKDDCTLDARNCHSCLRLVADGWRFCAHCGHELKT